MMMILYVWIIAGASQQWKKYFDTLSFLYYFDINSLLNGILQLLLMFYSKLQLSHKPQM